jgi:hypothetical protein
VIGSRGGSAAAPKVRRRGVGVLLVLIFLVVAVAAADRIVAVIAERSAASLLADQAQFVHPPRVAINGIPFLTQAAEGNYRDVQVRSDGVTVDGVSAVSLDVHLRGVHLPLRAALGISTIHQLVCDSIDGSVTFAYGELARLSKVGGLVLAMSGGRVKVSATLPIPILGQTLPVSGVAGVRIVAGAVVLDVSQLVVAGVTLPQAAVDALALTFAQPIPIPALPFGLVVTSATPGPQGVAVAASAQHTVIDANP